jgi:hypothetical protein
MGCYPIRAGSNAACRLQVTLTSPRAKRGVHRRLRETHRCVKAARTGICVTMAEQRTREIDWAGAEVRGGALTVPLSGSTSKAWSQDFEGVLRLLDQGHGGWGKVSLAKKAIEVADLQPGSESQLRHFLESVVVQVNTELAPAEEQSEEDPTPTDSQQADREMTEALRAFAQG